MAQRGTWEVRQDASGEVYYHNPVTGVSQWDKPEYEPPPRAAAAMRAPLPSANLAAIAFGSARVRVAPETRFRR